MELLDALGELRKLHGVVIAHHLLPVLHHIVDARIVLAQTCAERLGGRDVGRHVDAARFHHDCIDQAIDPFDVERALRRGLDLGGERGVAQRVEHRRPSKRQRGDCQKREDHIELGRDRQFRHLEHCHPESFLPTCHTSHTDPLNKIPSIRASGPSSIRFGI